MTRNPTFPTFPTFHIFPIPLTLLFLLCTLACESSDSHQASDAHPASDVHQASDAHPAEIQSGHLQLQAALDTPASTIQTRFITKSGNADFIALTLGSIGIFYGESERMNGTLDLSGNQLEFSMQVRSLKTGIARRDRDMYAVLDADRFLNPHQNFFLRAGTRTDYSASIRNPGCHPDRHTGRRPDFLPVAIRFDIRTAIQFPGTFGL